jgi:hypothetical protein
MAKNKGWLWELRQIIGMHRRDLIGIVLTMDQQIIFGDGSKITWTPRPGDW